MIDLSDNYNLRASFLLTKVQPGSFNQINHAAENLTIRDLRKAYLEKAKTCNPANVHALINSTLLDWANGQITDTDFIRKTHDFLNTKSPTLAIAVIYVFCTALGLPLALDNLSETISEILENESFSSTVLSQFQKAIKMHLGSLGMTPCGFNT